MTRQNQSYTEGLAQITTEEGQLAYGAQRYFLGFLALGFWAAFMAYTFTDATLGSKWQGEAHPGVIAVLFILAAGFSLGSWWANRIHNKLSNLRERTEAE